MKIQKINLLNPIKTPKFNGIEKIKKAENPQTISTNPIKSYPVEYYAPITFKANTQASYDEPTFDETIKENYFQLPILKNHNGESYQAMPDRTQLASAQSLYKGDNTITIAPTGVGKTAIANYVITKNLKEGKKTYYTTPLKALSNDKYREFCKLYGEENVGLLTGDIKLKKDAPVVIMTTEIYRNMALAQYADPEKDRFVDVNTVVFDEAHYINENERGKIWEESIIFTPKNIQILPLSATVGNAKQFAAWIDSISTKDTNLIEANHKDRFVPLVFYEYRADEPEKFKKVVRAKVDLEKLQTAAKEGTLTDREKRGLNILTGDPEADPSDVLAKMASSVSYNPVKEAEFVKLARNLFSLKESEAIEASQLLLDEDTKTLDKHTLDPFEAYDKKENYNALIHDLQEADKLPAIIFKFSRSACDKNTDKLIKQKINLTSPEEKKQIEEIIESYKKNNVYLGKNFDPQELTSGVAAHHAGLLPGYKKLVEELFSKKLVKVVFATSTLSAGINMPAKTVVITSLERPSVEYGDYETISVNEFQQMSGRAGRRGIDRIGNVVLYNLREADKESARSFMFKNPDSMMSKYAPSYNFLASFYKKNERPEDLNTIIEDTFLLHQAGENKPLVERRLKSEISKFEDILERYKFLEKTQNGFKTTPKGDLLTKAHGYSELTLVDMIYHKKLDNLSANELASFAASMVDSGIEFDDDKVVELVDDLLINICEDRKKYEVLDVFDDATKFSYDIESREKTAGILTTPQTVDVFSGYLAYNWLNLMDEGIDSVKSFKAILKDPDCVNNQKKQFPGFGYYPFKQVFEGDVFSVLSQTTDVLKQIINICEYALNDYNYYEDWEYYGKLLDTAKEAVEKMKQPPLHDGLSVA